MVNKNLGNILQMHKLWLNSDGINGKRANLRNADLYSANLYSADLYGADLYGANLYDADLRNADLYDADLKGANLTGAYLYGANLSQANIGGVKGIIVHSIDNVGTYNGKITYVPSLNRVYAGCWNGTSEDFFVKCKEVIKENDKDLYLDIALSMVKQLHDKYKK